MYIHMYIYIYTYTVMLWPFQSSNIDQPSPRLRHALIHQESRELLEHRRVSPHFFRGKIWETYEKMWSKHGKTVMKNYFYKEHMRK